MDGAQGRGGGTWSGCFRPDPGLSLKLGNIALLPVHHFSISRCEGIAVISNWSCRFGFYLLFLAVFVQAAPGAEPPNVVMIISDDQAWTDFGFMGHPVIETPHLDGLARQSIVFPRGYVPSSLCRPSLATIITGLYPHQHGITGNDPPQGVDRNEMLKHIRAAETLPGLLGQRGYRSFQAGKWWEGHHSLGDFTAGMTHGEVARGGRHGDVGLTIGREGLEPIRQFVRADREKPFFLWYAPFLPHEPHNPPERILAKYMQPGRPPRLARYYAMCEWFDETCGELLKILDDEGLRDNTLVAFVVDNGWIQQTGPRRTTEGWYAPRSKRSPYEGGARTPILLRWPGHIEPGRNETLVSSIDLAPTILTACEAEVPRRLPGVNLLEVAAGQPPDRDAIFGEIFAHDVADVDDPAASLLYRMCWTGHWKLILPHQQDQLVELFNLAVDPHEDRNLAEAQAEQVERMTAMIRQWWPLDADQTQ
jgi:uncharacterized sulfatase